jgi:hypothetical protein
VDRGWLRILGAGSDKLERSLRSWNEAASTAHRQASVLVADDALGGAFAWQGSPPTIHYWAPDTLEWEDLGLGYASWLWQVLDDGLQGFYEDLKWPGWADEVEGLSPDSGLHVWPPLVAGGQPLVERSRRAVEMAELWSFNTDLSAQLADLPDGAQVAFEITDSGRPKVRKAQHS